MLQTDFNLRTLRPQTNGVCLKQTRAILPSNGFFQLFGRRFFMLQLLFCVTYFRYRLTAEQTISVNIVVVVAAIAAAVVVQEGFRVGRKAKNKILFNSNNVDNIVAYRVDRHVGGVENLESVMYGVVY